MNLVARCVAVLTEGEAYNAEKHFKFLNVVNSFFKSEK